MTPQDMAILSRQRRTSPFPRDPSQAANVYAQLGPLGADDSPRANPNDASASGLMSQLERERRVNPIRTSVPSFTIPPALANNGDVNAAYQRLMQGTAEADQQTGTLNRNLQDYLAQSQKDKLRQTMTANAKFADRGIFNSGVGLQANNEIEQAYNQNDASYNQDVQDALQSLARSKLGLQTDFQNAQVTASAQAQQDKADADAAALQAQNDAAEQDRLIAQIMAQLTPQVPAYTPPPAAPPYVAPKPKPPVSSKPKPPAISGQTGYLLQGPRVGPQ